MQTAVFCGCRKVYTLALTAPSAPWDVNQGLKTVSCRAACPQAAVSCGQLSGPNNANIDRSVFRACSVPLGCGGLRASRPTVDLFNEPGLAVSQSFLRDLCGRGVGPDAVDAGPTAGRAGVGFGGGDDLAVAGPQPEAELAGPVPVKLEFGVGQDLGPFRRPVLDLGPEGVFADAFDALAAGRGGGVDLRGQDALAVDRPQVEFYPGLHPAHHKSAHFTAPLCIILYVGEAFRLPLGLIGC